MGLFDNTTQTNTNQTSTIQSLTTKKKRNNTPHKTLLPPNNLNS